MARCRPRTSSPVPVMVDGINEKLNSQEAFCANSRLTAASLPCVGGKATVRSRPRSASSIPAMRLGPGAFIWSASKDMVETIERFGTERGLSFWATGPTDRCRRNASPQAAASARRRTHVVVTVWDGQVQKPISTMKSRPTSAIRPSIPMARSMGNRELDRLHPDPRSCHAYRDDDQAPCVIPRRLQPSTT